MTVKIYTGRLNTNGPNPLNITSTEYRRAKESGEKLPWLALAPTDEMVRRRKKAEGHKKFQWVREPGLSWGAYTEMYRKILTDRYQLKPQAFTDILDQGEFTLTCYCGDPHHCHRTLAVDFLKSVAKEHGYDVEYAGEHRSTTSKKQNSPSLSLRHNVAVSKELYDATKGMMGTQVQRIADVSDFEFEDSGSMWLCHMTSPSGRTVTVTVHQSVNPNGEKPKPRPIDAASSAYSCASAWRRGSKTDSEEKLKAGYAIIQAYGDPVGFNLEQLLEWSKKNASEQPDQTETRIYETEREADARPVLQADADAVV